MFDPTDPGEQTFDPETKTGVGDTAVFSQVQVPFIGFAGKVVFFDPLLEQGIVVDSLASADKLAISF
jgi:hypothetical protein